VQRDLLPVATIDEAIFGSAMDGDDGHRGWKDYVAVHPRYQRRGFVRALTMALEERLARLRSPKTNLQVRASN
jgi:ribosomal protein S18 acetylase RimI-like enzyme